MEWALVTDQVIEIGFLGTRNQLKNVLIRQVEQGFSSFFAIFDDFTKFHSAAFCALRYEKPSNMAKKKNWQKMTKSLVQLAFNQFLTLISGCKNPISETRSIATK